MDDSTSSIISPDSHPPVEQRIKEISVRSLMRLNSFLLAVLIVFIALHIGTIWLKPSSLSLTPWSLERDRITDDIDTNKRLVVTVVSENSRLRRRMDEMSAEIIEMKTSLEDVVGKIGKEN